MRKRIRRTLLAAVALMSTASAGAPAAAAADWISCYGEGPGGATPGFTMEPTNVQGWVEIRLEPCVSSVPTIHSGDLHVLFEGPAATCLRPNVLGTATIDWDDGSVSEMKWISSGVPPAVVIHGRITGGTAFVGNEVLIPALTLVDGAFSKCNEPEGVTSFEFKELDFVL